MDTAAGMWILLILYITPTIVALSRSHQIGMVAILNVFLGWTFIGWIVALAIACGDRGHATVSR